MTKIYVVDNGGVHPKALEEVTSLRQSTRGSNLVKVVALSSTNQTNKQTNQKKQRGQLKKKKTVWTFFIDIPATRTAMIVNKIHSVVLRNHSESKIRKKGR
jgi:hypothetical protein